MRKWMGLAGAGCLWAVMAQAQGISLTFTPEGAGDALISWSALPLDLADAQPVIAPDDVQGPWQVDLPAGHWIISGTGTDGHSYETVVQVEAGGDAAIPVPRLAMTDSAAWSCHGQPVCTYSDEHSGLSFALPDNWGAEPFLVLTGPDGSLPKGPTGGFFEMAPDGGAYWALNPVDWVQGETGPCHEMPLGLMCTYDETASAKAAFDVIVPALNWNRP